MKKAVAYIDKRVIIELLKVPYNVEVIGMEYPSRDDRIKVVFKGEGLPVKASGPKTKRLPEIIYTVVRHWTLAKIEPRPPISKEQRR